MQELGPPGNDMRNYAMLLNDRHRSFYQKSGGPHLKGWMNRANNRLLFIDTCK